MQFWVVVFRPGFFVLPFQTWHFCTDFSDIVGTGLDIIVKKLTELFGKQYLNHQAGQALYKWDRRVQATCSQNERKFNQKILTDF
jgi:hypothetical protein